jgi:mevalonate kinase
LSEKAYPAKILLFGEYTVTNGSPALAIPFYSLSGKWSFKNAVLDNSLFNLLHYIKSLPEPVFIDFPEFEKDIKNGLFFESKIPSGYGLGSSGALIAAVYDLYGIHKKQNPEELRKDLALLESHFHGESSGIDPIVSYLKEPVLLTPEKSIIPCKIPSTFPFTFFILDSFHERNTRQWVSLFKEKQIKEEFFPLIVKNLSSLNTQAINSISEENYDNLWSAFLKISSLQFDHFREFIPVGHQDIWKKGLMNEKYILKLCGAGGGGFTLGITKNSSMMINDLLPFAPRWVGL